MLEAGFWGRVGGSSLVLGAALGIWLPIPRRVVALVMGFGAGALVSALAFDLTAEAFEEGGAVLTAFGLAAGGLTFFIGEVLIESGAGKAGAGGLAIVLGAQERRPGHAAGLRPRVLPLGDPRVTSPAASASRARRSPGRTTLRSSASTDMGSARVREG
jgi:ZIP family zinc transporter